MQEADLAPLVEALAKEGIRLDAERGAVVLPARIQVRQDLLEYLLVGPRGQMHESLLATEVNPSALNAALLALGVTAGTNARWVRHGDQDAPGERAADREGLEILPPEGEGFFLYVAWSEDGETRLYRAEDLVSNLATGRSLRRHRFVYLGSRFVTHEEGEPEVFLAEAEGNLINLTFFFSGATLLTAALPECVEQTIWAPNFWLLPEREAPVAFVLARERLESWPEAWKASLPEVPSLAEETDEPGDAR